MDNHPQATQLASGKPHCKLITYRRKYKITILPQAFKQTVHSTSLKCKNHDTLKKRRLLQNSNFKKNQPSNAQLTVTKKMQRIIARHKKAVKSRAPHYRSLAKKTAISKSAAGRNAIRNGASLIVAKGPHENGLPDYRLRFVGPVLNAGTFLTGFFDFVRI
jgi:hypothetical protein